MTSRLFTLFMLATLSTVANEHAIQKEPEAQAPPPEPAQVAPAQNAAPEKHQSEAATHNDAILIPLPPAQPPDAAVDSKKSAPGPLQTIHPPKTKGPQAATPEEIASLVRIGQAKVEQGDYVSSELAFRQVLAEKATPEQDHAALMGLGRTYRKKTEFTKAAAVYETLIKQSPDDPLLPIVYLELGRTLRALGAYKPAIARFYSVINSTLKLPEDNADNYRQLARTAQFEIAETYFQSGDYEQANRFFSRLKLLDLAPEDRARAHFKSIYALTLSGEHEKAVSGFHAYLDQNPNDENVPEARYLLSISLRQLKRYNESLAAALELLRAEKKYVQTDPKRWTYWQRKTGNQLANQFYEQGDFGSALVIYQNLASISPDPIWRLPVLYQIGICNERLHLYDRARECYQTIIETAGPTSSATPRRPELVDLFEMADWRLKHLVWEQTTDRQLKTIFPNDPARSAALSANDLSPNASAAQSPGLVR
jgi:tetratricopeptide (TPR) repeat protein